MNPELAQKIELARSITMTPEQANPTITRADIDAAAERMHPVDAMLARKSPEYLRAFAEEIRRA
jgi:hypothetical protein